MSLRCIGMDWGKWMDTALQHQRVSRPQAIIVSPPDLGTHSPVVPDAQCATEVSSEWVLEQIRSWSGKRKIDAFQSELPQKSLELKRRLLEKISFLKPKTNLSKG